MGKKIKFSTEPSEEPESDMEDGSDSGGEVDEYPSYPSQSGSDDDDVDKCTLGDKAFADVPLEMIESLRRDGRGLSGAAARNAAASATAKERSRDFHRSNKDCPQEISSKRPVSRFREVIQVSKKTGKDPRFSEEAGRLNDDAFRKRYKFLYDNVLPEEVADLKSQMSKAVAPAARAQLQASLTRVQQQLRQESLRQRTEKLEQEALGREASKVRDGKKPFFLKDSERKKLALQAKFEDLKSRGKLERFMERRRKKNAAKDHRYLPSSRRTAMD
mmetsp:Transcript_14762/g.26002  ORF Transcript_14762/g.26002 Transcript_14762/m.26002 type:complete len:274 (-) Transcript_14762:345-1166(-)|eukprot:CAMPEP_0175060182 /NCGR_PEP_ID=MMETSP0052_2-20121109/12857_1 /TAXON_ID=51329 ORGANISM="Polytomella parva, Strain SAG 63-3" /NCGR_SAMPLE_ID=MMETSP0052_2 /ASSEMBLY_ACC=CAM_ASM_000194 /LENGTH=273 /DNA_ID=CAMNT_0016325837 /DNA_START=87 /DNA_END=908 /DNA_ORIENTATION=+